MRKKILAFVFAAPLLMALAVPLLGGVGTASAQVHAISQASCGASVNAGATQSSDTTPGGPGMGPIPVVAGGAIVPGGGGQVLDGVKGDGCDAPGDVRQN